MPSTRTVAASDLELHSSGTLQEVVHTELSGARQDHLITASAVQLHRLKPVQLLGRSGQGVRVIQVCSCIRCIVQIDWLYRFFNPAICAVDSVVESFQSISMLPHQLGSTNS